jgi:hypothetical protein
MEELGEGGCGLIPPLRMIEITPHDKGDAWWGAVFSNGDG